MKLSGTLQLVSTFRCSPLEVPLQTAARESGIASVVRITPPQRLIQYMLAPSEDSEDIIGTIVLIRMEDWLREYVVSDSGPLSDAVARHELRRQLDEFLSHLAILTMRGRPVWLIICPSNGWISEHYKMTTLCRTMANLLALRIRNLPQALILNWTDSLSNADINDRETDRNDHVPFTAPAFQALSVSIVSQVAEQVASSDMAPDVRASTGSAELAAFLARLLVNVTITPASAEDRGHIDRILRTAASFSLAGEDPTLSEAAIDKVMSSEYCCVMSVSDRLSQYGVSGVVAGHTEADALVVDALSLSCTVLGKQVEYALLSALAQIATSRQLAKVVFQFRPGERNQPTHAFLRTAAKEEPDHQFVLPVEEISTRIEQSAIAPNEWTLEVVIPQRGSSPLSV